MASTPPKTPVTSRRMSSSDSSPAVSGATTAAASSSSSTTTTTASAATAPAVKPSPDSVTHHVAKTMSFGDPKSSVVDDMGMENVFIGISGLIGAGKTTLATALAKVLHLPVYYEPVADNIYLEDYYKDMSKYAFGLQVYLLNRRFKQHQQIVWTGQGGVQDRTIYEDAVFAKMLCRAGHLEERDYKTYISLFNNMSNFMKKPNIIVHLDVSPEESLRRVRGRDRNCESGMTLEFLQNLHDAYEEFLHDIARLIPVIKVSYDNFHTAEEMADRIAVEYANIQNIRHVDFGPVPKALTPSPTGSGTTSPKDATKTSKAEDALPSSSDATDAPVL